MKHGTHARYSKGCRCEPCKTGHRIYEREAARRRRRVKYGIQAPDTKFMESGPVVEHIHFLSTKGIGLGAIATQVGTNRATIQYIKRGKYSRVTTRLGNKILAVPAIPRMPMAYTDTKPIHDLLATLEKKGVSRKDIGRAIGCRYGDLKVGKKMRVWRFNKVKQACDEVLRRMP